MNIYYTAKDIEDLAAKGIHQLELGPGVTLTDFARETAQQLGISLVNPENQVTPSIQSTTPSAPTTQNDRYNKPKGCLHASGSLSPGNIPATVPSEQSTQSSDSNTVNRLVDLMGKVIRRGG